MLLRLSPVNAVASAATNGDAAPAALLVHLGMTGQIASKPAAQPCEKHTHARFLLDDTRELRYRSAPLRAPTYLSAGPLAEELQCLGRSTNQR